MKYVYVGIAALVAAILLFGGGFLARGYYDREYAYKIVTKTPIKQYDVQPVSLFYGDLLAARMSPIAIDGTMRGNTLWITADDGYKAAERGFKVGRKATPNIIGLSYMMLVNTTGSLYNCGLAEYYRMFGRVGVGGGVLAGMAKDKTNDWIFGAKVGVIGTF